MTTPREHQDVMDKAAEIRVMTRELSALPGAKFWDRSAMRRVENILSGIQRRHGVAKAGGRVSVIRGEEPDAYPDFWRTVRGTPPCPPEWATTDGESGPPKDAA